MYKKVADAGLFPIEIRMMTTTLRDMQALLPETKISGKCLYTQSENPELLVIEDLAPLGFRMADREAGMDLDHCILALRGLAKFHASSVAVYEKVSIRLQDKTYTKLINKERPSSLKPGFNLV